jgi:hypothetical protein
MEKPYQGKAIVEDGFDYFKITIPAKRSYFLTVFLCVWMGGWVFGESFAIGEIWKPGFKETDLFLVFWLCGWTLGGLVVVKTIVWQFIGKEIIEIGQGTFGIRRKGDWLLGKEKVYDLNECKCFRAERVPSYLEGRFNNSFNFFNRDTQTSKGAFVFDYGMKTIRFGEAVDEVEAKYLLDKLKTKRILTDKNF